MQIVSPKLMKINKADGGTIKVDLAASRMNKKMEICYRVFSSHEECETPRKAKQKAREIMTNRNANILVSLSKLSCSLNLDTFLQDCQKIDKS